MDESELQDFRRKRLSDWLSANGGAHAVCVRRGLKRSTESYISQILGGETFGHRAARNMEAKLGMDRGYLDDVGPGAGPLPSPIALELAYLFDDIVAGMGPRDRSIVYQAAQEAITRPIARHGAQPTDTLSPPATPKKQRA